MKRQVILVLLLAPAVLAALWQAGATLLRSSPPGRFEPRSFHPPPAAEPISPIPRSMPLDTRKVALGKRLFHDKRLSRDNKLACSSCHDLAKGGADGEPRSIGAAGQRADRNAPTVFNSVFNFRQFWDGRAAGLEDQIDGPLENPKEMASSWREVMAKLGADDYYPMAFRELYGSLEPRHVKNAIAEFERSLVTPGARFDRYLEGERNALTAEELRGYRLFKSYGCIACHQGVNVGGNLYERLGVLHPYAGQAATNPDTGRMAITGNPADMLVFKVPGLRNVARTAPYFHDGSVPTLEQAVSLMGRYQLGVAIPARDVALIVGFLRTLDGRYEEAPQ